jgi:HAMP domain-containing protein
MRSLGSEIRLINIVLSDLLMAALATGLGLHLSTSGRKRAEATISSRNEAIRYFIEGYFSEIQAAVEVLADNVHVRRAHANDASREEALGNTNKLAFYSRIDDVGWVVITVVEEREILVPIRRGIAFLLALLILATAVITAVQVTVLRRRLVRPVRELQRRVRAIVGGEEIAASEYEFPENEIGVTAHEVSQLAEHELLEKSHRLQETNEEIRSPKTGSRRDRSGDPRFS